MTPREEKRPCQPGVGSMVTVETLSAFRSRLKSCSPRYLDTMLQYLVSVSHRASNLQIRKLWKSRFILKIEIAVLRIHSENLINGVLQKKDYTVFPVPKLPGHCLQPDGYIRSTAS